MKPPQDCKTQSSHAAPWARAFANRLPDANRAAQDAAAHLRQHGIAEPVVHNVHFAIEEMATNIVKYGYDDRAPHTITLRLEILPDAVCARLEDDGHEFNPLQVPTPALPGNLDDRTPGGLGIYLVRRMVSAMTYERRDDKNHLTITVSRVP